MSETIPTPTAPKQSEQFRDTGENFGELLSQFERSHTRATGEGSKQLRGTVVSVTADAVYVDIGYKTEGVLPLAAFVRDKEPPKAGDTLLVSSKGRNEEGYYDLSKLEVEQPKDWESLEEACAARSVVSGTVTGVVNGGLTVEVGVRAFLPNSRSGARAAA